MNGDMLYDPSPIQQEFHLCTADEALLGGSAGPGKSLALLMDPIQTQLFEEHERWKATSRPSNGWALHLRREYPMLQETLERADRIFRQIDRKVHWNGDDKIYTFQCGYKFQFGHMREVTDWKIYDSKQYTHVGMDELIQFEFEQYNYLKSRVRSTDPVLRKKLRTRGATNPGPGWVRDYFVDPAPEGRKLLTRVIQLDDGTTETRSRVFIPATLKDNPDAEYRRQYEANLKDQPTHITQARLYGNWYVVAGAFFAKVFIPSVHIVAPYKIPDGWTRFRSMDWGFRSPGCIHWWAVDRDGSFVCYRELTFKEKYDYSVAQEVEAIERANGEWDTQRNCSRLSGPADTQIWSNIGTKGPTIAETMFEHGVAWEKCTKNKFAAVQQLFSRLGDVPPPDSKARPGISFFATCKDIIRTLPSVATDAKDTELPKDGGDDHWLDSVLYAAMYRPVVPKFDALPVRLRDRDELEEARERKTVKRQRPGGKYGYGGW